MVIQTSTQYHLWASGDRSSVHGGRSGRTASARLVFEATAQTIVRLNANDPSVCAALASAHFLGTDA